MGNGFYIEPHLIRGGIRIDDRGEVVFCNDFEFAGVKRFYLVRSHRTDFVRAWHAHKVEHKFIMCLQGAALVGAVQVDNWSYPEPTKIRPLTFVLSEKEPAILHIPCGWANGFKTLRPDTLMMFYSTSNLEESLKDDYRFDPYLWNCWQMEEK